MITHRFVALLVGVLATAFVVGCDVWLPEGVEIVDASDVPTLQKRPIEKTEPQPDDAPGDVVELVLAQPADPAPVSGAEGVTIATIDDLADFFAENQDQVIVMNFWATWCKPCIHEMPELAAFDREYRDQGVAFLSLSTDAAEDIDTKLKPYVAEADLPFTVYAIANLDPDALQQVLKVEMDFGLPTTFVLDKDREVAQVWMRNIEKQDLVDAVTPLL